MQNSIMHYLEICKAMHGDDSDFGNSGYLGHLGGSAG